MSTGQDHSASGPWRAGLVVELLLFVAAFLALKQVGPSTGITPRGASGGALLAFLAVTVPLWTLLTALALRLRGDSLADIGLRRPSRGWVWTVVLAVPAGMLILTLAGVAGEFFYALGLRPVEMEWSDTGPSGRLAFWGCAALAGFGEELVYRGYLLTRCEQLFTTARGGSRAFLTAALVTSLLFGGQHLYQGALGAAVITVIGLLFCALVALSRRNLVTAMIAHATIDVIVLG